MGQTGEASGRQTGMAAEGGAERAGGAISDTLGHFVEGQVAPAQEILGESHAPGGKILHRAKADGSGEPVKEG